MLIFLHSVMTHASHALYSYGLWALNKGINSPAPQETELRTQKSHVIVFLWMKDTCQYKLTRG